MVKSIKKQVNEKEKAYAKKTGMTKCLASGATIWGKGDCVDDVFMVDLKTTIGTKQTTIKRAELEKAYLDALSYNPPKIPVIHIMMGDFECDVLFSRDFQYLRELAIEDDATKKQKNK